MDSNVLSIKTRTAGKQKQVLFMNTCVSPKVGVTIPNSVQPKVPGSFLLQIPAPRRGVWCREILWPIMALFLTGLAGEQLPEAIEGVEDPDEASDDHHS